MMKLLLNEKDITLKQQQNYVMLKLEKLLLQQQLMQEKKKQKSEWTLHKLHEVQVHTQENTH